MLLREFIILVIHLWFMIYESLEVNHYIGAGPIVLF